MKCNLVGSNLIRIRVHTVLFFLKEKEQYKKFNYIRNNFPFLDHPSILTPSLCSLHSVEEWREKSMQPKAFRIFFLLIVDFSTDFIETTKPYISFRYWYQIPIQFTKHQILHQNTKFSTSNTKLKI